VKVVGLISSWKDGELVAGAARSLLPACDKVYVYDAPIVGAGDEGETSSFERAYSGNSLRVRHSRAQFEDDAAKRTALLKWAQHEQGPGTWAVVLDSDEVLLWAEYLRDFLALAAVRPVTAAGGFPLRLVELDGSVALVSSRVFPLHALDRYELSVHTVWLKDAPAPIALPNQQVCYMHGAPLNATDPRCRPPLQGEPHILHRTMLRDVSRQVERQHEAEGRWFEERKAQ
jgi:hypothetical protein